MNKPELKDSRVPWLVDRDFFTLEEVTTRWKALLDETITPQTILDFGVRDESDLIFSIYVNNWFLFRKAVGANGVTSITRESLSGLVDLHPWTIKELRVKESVEVTWVKACSGATACAVSTHHWGHNPESWRAVFDHHLERDDRTFPWIARSDLRIRRSERDRLELLFKQHAPQDPPNEISIGGVSEERTVASNPDQVANETNVNNVESETHLSPEPAGKKGKIKPGSWQEKAYLIAHRLDPERQAPHMGAFAIEIRNKLKNDGVGNRSKNPPSLATIERDILRGWKNK